MHAEHVGIVAQQKDIISTIRQNAAVRFNVYQNFSKRSLEIAITATCSRVTIFFKAVN